MLHSRHDPNPSRTGTSTALTLYGCCYTYVDADHSAPGLPYTQSAVGFAVHLRGDSKVRSREWMWMWMWMSGESKTDNRVFRKHARGWVRNSIRIKERRDGDTTQERLQRIAARMLSCAGTNGGAVNIIPPNFFFVFISSSASHPCQRPPVEGAQPRASAAPCVRRGASVNRRWRTIVGVPVVVVG
ncbi:hypothetical protein C8R44DRAFT_738265 [Mycena epipterygia]|nr:hypothetical protein C8R44DRAFT_738265 [Mycena epipterygia]